MRLRMPLILYLQIQDSFYKPEFNKYPSDIPAVEMEPLADEQKCLFTGEKSFSCSRNVLVGRVSTCS
jgi:hypothetical protein